MRNYKLYLIYGNPTCLKQHYITSSTSYTHNYIPRLTKNVKPRELLCLDPSKPTLKWIPRQGGENFLKRSKAPKDKNYSQNSSFNIGNYLEC